MAITIQHLDNKTRILNEATGNPLEPFTYGYTPNDGSGKFHIGNYSVVENYGLFQLVQIVNENGGEDEIFYGKTKRELYLQITAMLEGIRIGKNCEAREVA